jgi:hypothetical protein
VVVPPVHLQSIITTPSQPYQSCIFFLFIHME